MKKTRRSTKKKGGLTMPNMRNMAATARTHLANAQRVMNDVTKNPEVANALSSPSVQHHLGTAVSALSNAAQRSQNPLASTMLNKAAAAAETSRRDEPGAGAGYWDSIAVGRHHQRAAAGGVQHDRGHGGSCGHH